MNPPYIQSVIRSGVNILFLIPNDDFLPRLRRVARHPVTIDYTIAALVSLGRIINKVWAITCLCNKRKLQLLVHLHSPCGKC